MLSETERKERHRKASRECQRRKREALRANPEALAEARVKENEWRREYRKREPERFREHEKRRYLRRKGVVSARGRHRATGWTQEDVDRAWQEQEGRCAICEVALQRDGVSSVSATADHDHETGQKRALLCRRCNLLEGHHLQSGLDEEEWARRVKAYRAKYRT